MGDSKTVDVYGLHAIEATVSLPLLAPPPEAECSSNVDQWRMKLEDEQRGGHMGRILHAEGMLRFAEYELSVARQDSPDLIKPFTVQLLTVGDIQLLGLPGEMFVQYAIDFQRQSRSCVFPIAYANGVHGYVPTAADYPFGGYEVDGSHRYYGTLAFAPESERLIRETVYELLGIDQPDWTSYSV
jgi:hypothetical protein